MFMHSHAYKHTCMHATMYMWRSEDNRYSFLTSALTEVGSLVSHAYIQLAASHDLLRLLLSPPSVLSQGCWDQKALPCAWIPMDSGHQTQAFTLAQQALCLLSHLLALGSQFWRFLIHWLGSFECVMGQHIMGVKGAHRESCSLHCAQTAKRRRGLEPRYPFKVTLPVTRSSSRLCFSRFQTSLE